MSLDRNRILVRLTAELEEREDADARINLQEILSYYTPPPGADAPTTAASSMLLPNIPLRFDKNSLFEFILRALAKQFENSNGVKFTVLKALSDFDRVICRYGPPPATQQQQQRDNNDNNTIPIQYKLVLQMLVHLSKIASDDSYDVSMELENDIATVCWDMSSIPLHRLPKFAPSPDASRARILKFLTRPSIVDLFLGQLERYEEFADLSAPKVKLLLDEIVIYESAESRWYMFGWTVIDGIVLMLGSLPDHVHPNYWANLYTLCLHEAAHYLARRLSGNFGFSSPGKDRQFNKDPDAKLAEKGRGLELGRSLEWALLGMEVRWSATPPDVAEEFVRQVENEHHKGPYLADKRHKLTPQKYPCSYSGMSIDMNSYYHIPRF